MSLWLFAESVVEGVVWAVRIRGSYALRLLGLERFCERWYCDWARQSQSFK